MIQAQVSKTLQDSAPQLPTPKSYFKGLTSFSYEIPNNILCFYRSKSSDLGEEFHYHHRFVLIINLGTPGTVVLDRKSHNFLPNHAILVFPHQFHHFMQPSSDSIQWLFITFELGHRDKYENLKNKTSEVASSCQTYLQNFIANYLEEGGSPKESASSLPFLLGAILAELLKAKGTHNADPSFHQRTRIDEVKKYIWDHFDESLSLKDLVQAFSCSESHLRHLFRQQVGMSIGKYITKVKLNRAQSLLVNSSMNVSQIAYTCGYSSVYSFSRAFKKRTGHSPVSYKKMVPTRY